MVFKFKDAVLPCNEKEDFNTNNISVDIICRIYLSEAPDEKHEKAAREQDGENYNPDCFFIECIAGKNEPDGVICTSDWMLYYVKETGEFIEFGFVDDVPDEAWTFFTKAIGVTFDN